MEGQPSAGTAAGGRADIPQPRARTPSPVKLLNESRALPPPARDFDIDPQNLDVIYAEDEEIFRETAVRELLKVGFARVNIHESDNGMGALEDLARLQTEGHCTLPLVVLLDVRMPGMDGRECAYQIQELVKKRLLRREPFVICISSIARQVIVDEGKGNFQVVLPKPFTSSMLEECFTLLKAWWSMGHGRQLPAWKPFDPSKIDVIVADDEPVCRLSSSLAFTQGGIGQQAVTEVEDETELLEHLAIIKDGDSQRPLIVLLGQVSWARSIRTWVDDQKQEGPGCRREPFVVCTSVDSDRLMNSNAIDNFHAVLPRAFTQADVKWCLELCRLWWLTRGDGVEDKDMDAGDDSSEEDMLEEESD